MSVKQYGQHRMAGLVMRGSTRNLIGERDFRRTGGWVRPRHIHASASRRPRSAGSATVISVVRGSLWSRRGGRARCARTKSAPTPAMTAVSKPTSPGPGGPKGQDTRNINNVWQSMTEDNGASRTARRFPGNVRSSHW